MITGPLVSDRLRVGPEISGVVGIKLVGVRRAVAFGVPAAQIDWPQ